jgi:hypothetical protein
VDYITKPAETGYRGIHLVCRHYSKAHPEYDGLQVEIQLRSRLQHIWATAVETVDTLARDFLKFGIGDVSWQRYFALVGTAFAIKEGTAITPGTPTDRVELVEELRDLTTQLNVEMRLQSYGEAVHITRMTEQRGDVRGQYYLLELSQAPDPKGHFLKITGYSARQHAQAEAELAEKEREMGGESGKDVVLVAAESIASLEAAYPNYYLDTRAFVTEMQGVLKG